MEKKLLIITGGFVGYLTIRLMFIGKPYDIVIAIIALALWFLFITVYIFNPKH